MASSTRRAPRSRSHPSLVDELIRAAAAGDRADFDRLFDLWFDVVFGCARRACDDDRSARELTRGTLCRAVRARLPET